MKIAGAGLIVAPCLANVRPTRPQARVAVELRPRLASNRRRRADQDNRLACRSILMAFGSGSTPFRAFQSANTRRCVRARTELFIISKRPARQAVVAAVSVAALAMN